MRLRELRLCCGCDIMLINCHQAVARRRRSRVLMIAPIAPIHPQQVSEKSASSTSGKDASGYSGFSFSGEFGSDSQGAYEERTRRLPKRIFLIRHGESEGNVDQTLYCRRAGDRSLPPLGSEEENIVVGAVRFALPSAPSALSFAFLALLSCPALSEAYTSDSATWTWRL